VVEIHPREDTMMQLTRRRTLQLITAAGALVVAPRLAAALEREPGGFYRTGSGVRVKHVGPFSAKVYAISHYMRDLPPSKSKQAVITMETDKALSWRLLRDLDAKQIQDAMRDGFKMNGYADQAKIQQFVGAFTKKVPENTLITITYKSAPKTTTIAVAGDGTATIPGSDFMRGVWSIWFGKIDQPELGDALVQRIPDSGGVGG
jgi:hypothetical protein